MPPQFIHVTHPTSCSHHDIVYHVCLRPSESLSHAYMTVFATFTSAEGADVVDVLTTHTALALLLEGLFLEDVGLSLPPLHVHTNTHTNKSEIHS